MENARSVISPTWASAYAPALTADRHSVSAKQLKASWRPRAAEAFRASRSCSRPRPASLPWCERTRDQMLKAGLAVIGSARFVRIAAPMFRSCCGGCAIKFMDLGPKQP